MKPTRAQEKAIYNAILRGGGVFSADLRVLRKVTDAGWVTWDRGRWRVTQAGYEIALASRSGLAQAALGMAWRTIQEKEPRP